MVGREDTPARLEPVEFGHADVHQDDGGAKAGGLVDRFRARYFASATTSMSSSPPRAACGNPARTIDWSSATSTRMVMACRPSPGGVRFEDEAPLRSAVARAHVAAVDLHPLADAEKPVAEAPARSSRTATVVAHFDLQLGRAHNTDGDIRLAGKRRA